MNTSGDGDEDLELLAQGLPLSAPVAADMGQSRTSHPYLPRSAVPAAHWGSRAAAEDPPVGYRYPYAADPAAVPAPAPPPPAPAPTAPAPTAEPAMARPAPPAPAPAEEPMAASEPEPSDKAGAAVGDDHPASDDPAASDERPGSGHAARDGHAAAVGRSGHERAPQPPSHTDYLVTGGTPGEPPEDPNRVILRKQLDALRVRAANAASWQEASQHYARLINSDGVVPVTARFSRDDIEFLGRAKEEVLGLAELGLRLLELHAPLDAGGISTDPSSPIMRCRSCMWRWPCPTFSLLSETVNQLPHPGSPSAR
jgi:hypothetical protein